MEALKRVWLLEPAAVIAAIQTIIALAVAFGIDLTGEQTGAILAAIAAVGGLFTRSQVSPTRALRRLANANAAAEAMNQPPPFPPDPPNGD